MTDKELRRLSRLELLELLLESGKENEKLRQEIKRLEHENKTVDSIENLSEISKQLEAALEYTNSISHNIKSAPVRAASVAEVTQKAPAEAKHKAAAESKAESGPMTDVQIYKRMLNFFANNDGKLSVFPADLENDVRARIKSLLERKKY